LRKKSTQANARKYARKIGIMQRAQKQVVASKNYASECKKIRKENCKYGTQVPENGDMHE